MFLEEVYGLSSLSLLSRGVRDSGEMERDKSWNERDRRAFKYQFDAWYHRIWGHQSNTANLSSWTH